MNQPKNTTLRDAELDLRRNGFTRDQVEALEMGIQGVFTNHLNIEFTPLEIVRVALEIRKQLSLDDRTEEPVKRLALILREKLMQDELLRLNHDFLIFIQANFPKIKEDEREYVARRVWTTGMHHSKPEELRDWYQMIKNILMVKPTGKTATDIHNRLQNIFNICCFGENSDQGRFDDIQRVRGLVNLDGFGGIILPDILKMDLSSREKEPIKRLIEAIKSGKIPAVHEALKHPIIQALQKKTDLGEIPDYLNAAEVTYH